VRHGLDVGRIQVDGDATGVSAQPLRMALDPAGRQGLSHTVEFLRSDRVLKARQRRLRGQIKSRNRSRSSNILCIGSAPRRAESLASG
jgi:hypothetical protein